MFWKNLLIISFSLLMFNYFYDEPLPADLAHDPGNIVIKHGFRIVSLIRNILGYFGVSNHYFFRCSLSLIQRKCQFTSDAIEVNDALFDAIPVRMFTPRTNKQELKPAIIYIHGGGFMFGSTDVFHRFTRQLALDSNSIVVSISYRLSPEHVFPAAYDDVFKAAAHFLGNGKKYGADVNRVALCGDSAGGNLAASVSIGLRDMRPDLHVKLQILMNPVTQCADFKLPSYQQNNKLTNYMLSSSLVATSCLNYALGFYTAELLESAIDDELYRALLKKDHQYGRYLNHSLIQKYMVPAWYTVPDRNKPDRITNDLKDRLLSKIANPLFSPLFAMDLSNLPEAYVIVSEYDVIRDDALLYIRRLRDAGVNATEAYYKLIHDGVLFSNGALVGGPFILESGKAAYTDMVNFIIDRL